MDYAAALTGQNQELGELLRDADWSVPVPTCPGWTLLQLLRHVGRGDRWAAQIITDRADTSLDPRSVSDGKPPADAPGAIRWLSQSPQILLAAVEGIGPGTEVATFTGPEARRLVDQAAAARGYRPPRRRRDRARRPVRAARRAGRGRHLRMAGAACRPAGPRPAAVPARRGDPGPAGHRPRTWPRAPGPSSAAPRACTGTADQPALTSPSPDPPPACCSPCSGAGRPRSRASACRETPRCGAPGWT